MSKKISNFLKSEIVSSVFYMAFGLCLILIPEQTIHVICKIIFGVVMIGAGLYHIWIYAGEKEKATILDLFTGVIVMVLGVFLFFTPQIIVKILPYLLGAFVLVDNIWMVKGAWRLKKLGNSHWKTLFIGSVAFAALGVAVMVYPFGKIMNTVLFAGAVMLADGIGDVIFLFLLRRGVKKGMVETEQKTEETLEASDADKEKKKSRGWLGKSKTEESKELPSPVQSENTPEESKEVLEIEEEIAEEEITKEEITKEEITEERQAFPLGEEEEEVLEEWKD